MLTYIVRRLLLMIPTLIGITIMVFLIARFAPGRPGQAQTEGAGISAEEARALAEWYEKRYGLDLPLWKQYFRWWRGMFFRDVQALAWHADGDTLLPVFTYRRDEPQYFARSIDGKWFAISRLEFELDTYLSDDPAFTERIHVEQLAEHPPRKEGYEQPRHTQAIAHFTAIESLDSVKETALKRATQPLKVPVQALAWSDPGGEPLFVNPQDPGKPLFERKGGWYELTPRNPLERSLINMVDAPAVAALLKRRMADLPNADDDYAVPRHAFVSGTIKPLAQSYDPSTLQRLTIPTEASMPVSLWARAEQEARAVTLYEPIEPLPRLLVQRGDQWHRLFGAVRAQLPRERIVRQSDSAFLAAIAEPERSKLTRAEAERREPRHAIFAGELRSLAADEPPPLPRDIRRYQHETNIFEVTLGESISSQTTVIEEMKTRLPITLMLNLIAFPLIYLIAIPAGMLMAVKRGKGFDTSANVSMLGLWSVPQVLAATLLIGYLAVGGAGLQLFPSGGLSSVGSDSLPFFGTFQEDGSFRAGWLLDRFWHLVLPVFCIVYGSFAYIAKQQRAAMLDNFTMDYVRTAKAKGVPGKDIVFRHVLRNSLLPLITIFATVLPALIAGSIILEKIFNIEGMGLLAFRAVQNRDYDVVQSLALIAGALNLIGLLLADVCYALADPRITYK